MNPQHPKAQIAVPRVVDRLGQSTSVPHERRKCPRCEHPVFVPVEVLQRGQEFACHQCMGKELLSDDNPNLISHECDSCGFGFKMAPVGLWLPSNIHQSN